VPAAAPPPGTFLPDDSFYSWAGGDPEVPGQPLLPQLVPADDRFGSGGFAGGSRFGPDVGVGGAAPPVPVRLEAYRPEAPPWSAMAVVAFVLALTGFGLVAIVLGGIARKRLRTSGERGNGLAVAAQWVGALGLLASIALGLLASNVLQQIREQLTGRGPGPSFAVGQCLEGVAAVESPTSVAVPCTEPHLAEVVATVPLPRESSVYPEPEVLGPVLEEPCLAAASALLPQEHWLAGVDVWWSVPDEQAWAQGSRTGMCLLGSEDVEVVGSYVAGTAALAPFQGL